MSVRTPPLRLGIVGYGRVVDRYHVPAIEQGCGWTIAAVADSSQARLATVDVTERHPSLESMVEAAQVDAVLIATPQQTHAPLIRAALERRLHVLVEKPMVTTVEDASAILGDAAASDRTLAVGFNRRFRRSYVAAKRQLRGRQIHAVRHTFVADVRQWRSPGAPRLALEDVLHDTASHQIDLLPWLLRRSLTGIRALERRDDDVGTTVKYELALEDDVLATCHAGHAARYCERLEVDHDRGATVVLPGGVFHARRAGSRLVTLRGAARSVAAGVRRRIGGGPNETIESFRRQLAAFADLIHGRMPDVRPAGPEDGARATRVVIACRDGFEEPGVAHAIDPA